MQEKIRQGMQLQRTGDPERAKVLYRQVLDLDGNHPDALHLYGLACRQTGDFDEAVQYLGRAVERVPTHPVLRNNLGDALRQAGDLEAARRQLKKALRLDPNHAGAHLNLGSVYYDLKQHEDALHHLEKTTRLAPQRAEGWYTLGLEYLEQVRFEPAISAFRRALEIRPEYPAAACALLYSLNLAPGLDPSEIADEHQSVAQGLFSNAIAADERPVSQADEAGEGSIVIGYVSGDFRAHAVNCFFEPILRHHDHERFRVVCYSDTERTDGTTERLKSTADVWRDIRSMADGEVADLVGQDRVDILVDLSGYTKPVRLGVFARRAAPCQVTYLGYPSTTGLAAMDFQIVDDVTVPDPADSPGSEQLIRLPGIFACFDPPVQAPDVAPLPSLRNGFVTFGSLHKLEKLNAEVIETWADVMNAVPESRLLIARDNLDAWHQERLWAALEHAGVSRDRVSMRDGVPASGSFLDWFADIDILLDCFPWCGHTMACMALWMGVPVITRTGLTHVERMVQGALQAVGLEDWIAGDNREYVDVAVRKSGMHSELGVLRSSLRDRVSASPLADHQGFTARYERALLQAAGIDQPA